MKRGDPRRKKASPSKEELSQTKTSPLGEKSENKRRKVKRTQTPGLRRSTRLTMIPQTTSKTTNYINLEEKKPNGKEPTEEEPIENTPT